MFFLAQTEPTGGSPFFSLFLFAALGLVFWLMVLRPQRRRVQERQQLAASLEMGQKVRTTGGVHGIIVGLDEETVTLKLAEGRMKVDRLAVVTVVGKDE